MLIITQSGEAINFDNVVRLRIAGDKKRVLVDTVTDETWELTEYAEPERAAAELKNIVNAYEDGSKVYRIPGE